MLVRWPSDSFGVPTRGRINTDCDVLQIMTERICSIAERVRDRIESTAKNGDDVTSNLLQELSYTLDKQGWQFRLHMQ